MAIDTSFAHSSVTGGTEIAETSPAEHQGTIVEISFRLPRGLFRSGELATVRLAASLAGCGTIYQGPSHPSWYGPAALNQLFAAAPDDATVAKLVGNVFDIDLDDDRYANSLSDADIADLDLTRRVGKPPRSIGKLGEIASGGQYRCVECITKIEGAEVPFTVEAYCNAQPAEKDEGTVVRFSPMINRSFALAQISMSADSTGLRVYGCGLDFKASGAKRARYTILLSLITPYLRLTGDGKAPYLGDFAEAIKKAIGDAARAAYRLMIRPPKSMSIVDAAYRVMKSAYLKASDNGRLPAKARQIMYAARGAILRLTGARKFSDTYFTQVLLPDYMNDFPDETANWDVVFDARGNLTEPHTGRRVPLGTIQVRTYLGDRAPLGPVVQIGYDTLFPTAGPNNRYRNILFVEKEGFDELFQAVQLAERYDLALMSTKGMSVVAARQLLDRLANQVDHIFVLHDFDVSGFSIFGTLGTDSRRYIFENDVSEKIIDIGLRLEDIEAMGLEAETVEVDSRIMRRLKLCQHGATAEEIEFLAPQDLGVDCRRVELNAMTSRQLVDFVEGKLKEHNVKKVMPENGVIETHARRLIEMAMTEKAIASMASDIAQNAANIALPDDLHEQIAEVLAETPEMSWDQALEQMLMRSS